MGNFSRELCKNGWMDPDAVLDVDLGGSKNSLLDEGTRWRNLANMTEPSTCGADVAFCQITLTTYVYYIQLHDLQLGIEDHCIC